MLTLFDRDDVCIDSEIIYRATASDASASKYPQLVIEIEGDLEFHKYGEV